LEAGAPETNAVESTKTAVAKPEINLLIFESPNQKTPTRNPNSTSDTKSTTASRMIIVFSSTEFHFLLGLSSERDKREYAAITFPNTYKFTQHYQINHGNLVDEAKVLGSILNGEFQRSSIIPVTKSWENIYV